MADEQHRWLDRDAAERLLRGEPLEGIAPHAQERADRLARTLAVLAEQGRVVGAVEAPGAQDMPVQDASVQDTSAQDAPASDAPQGAGGEPLREVAPPVGSGHDRPADAASPHPVPGELPGEAAALAAFRAARAELPQGAGVGSMAAPYATAAHRAAADETVRLSRAGTRPAPSRWGRPVRFGLAAALAACMVGGVAVAAGTGVLPSPFGAHHEPGPAASASSVATPDEPQASASRGASEPSEDIETDESTAPGDEPTGEPTAGPDDPTPGTGRGGETPAETPSQPSGERPPHRDEAKGWYRKVVTACRAYRSGELEGKKRRRLEDAAKGPARVEAFCGRILDGSGGGGHQGGGHQGGGGGGQGGPGGHDGDGENGSGGDEDDGGSHGGGDTGGAPVPPISPPTAPRATPTGSYSALPYLS
ncbi:hypothetical protein ACFYO9_04445 [Streptomyces sp. NPDC005863]|uniref:hypothetical protein n=1 Tax=unclassified Streptomyces TaxID=2593676 RepID=UPI0033FF6C83